MVSHGQRAGHAALDPARDAFQQGRPGLAEVERFARKGHTIPHGRFEEGECGCRLTFAQDVESKSA